MLDKYNSVYHDTESPSFLKSSSKNMEIVPEDIKQSESPDIFKSKSKN